METHKNSLQINQHGVEVGGSFFPPNGFKIQQMANESPFVSVRCWSKKAFYIAISFIFKQEKLQTSLQSRLVIVRDISRNPDTSHMELFESWVCVCTVINWLYSLSYVAGWFQQRNIILHGYFFYFQSICWLEKHLWRSQFFSDLQDYNHSVLKVKSTIDGFLFTDKLCKLFAEW